MLFKKGSSLFFFRFAPRHRVDLPPPPLLPCFSLRPPPHQQLAQNANTDAQNWQGINNLKDYDISHPQPYAVRLFALTAPLIKMVINAAETVAVSRVLWEEGPAFHANVTFPCKPASPGLWSVPTGGESNCKPTGGGL